MPYTTLAHDCTHVICRSAPNTLVPESNLCNLSPSHHHAQLSTQMETQAQAGPRQEVCLCYSIKLICSHLLNLPEDLLHHLLTSLPPFALRALSQTCSSIRIYLSHDSIWRDNYTRFYTAPLCLTQPCLDGRSWRSEGLAREAMIERIITSKSLPTTHYPSVGLIHTVSLYYPIPAIPAVSYRPTARQRYDARIAATVRPTPHILTAGVGAIVKSDPTSGKISKGFWGPSPNGKSHLEYADPSQLSDTSSISQPVHHRLSIPRSLFRPLRPERSPCTYRFRN